MTVNFRKLSQRKSFGTATSLRDNCEAVILFSKTVSFRLEQGTRKSCPVGSLLVAICIEPLSQRIIRNRNIRGIVVKGGEQKMSLFADDRLQNAQDILE